MDDNSAISGGERTDAAWSGCLYADSEEEDWRKGDEWPEREMRSS
jgi:hypothetical protein